MPARDKISGLMQRRDKSRLDEEEIEVVLMNINEAVLVFTKDIYYISLACAKKLVQFHSDKVVLDKEYGSIIREFDYLFIHIVDRYASGICSEDVKENFIEKLGLSVINARINDCAEGMDNNLIEEARSYEIDCLNKRNIEYAKYKKLYADKGEGTKNTLFWEFGKKIVLDCLHSLNPAEIVYCASIGSDIITNVKIEKVLEEII